MNNCYFISHNYKGLDSAGNKAKTDIENILQEQLGFRNIGLGRTLYRNKVVHFLLNLCGIVKAVATVGRGDVLLLQYPLKKYFSFVCNVAHMRGARVIALIHDLGSFRRKALTVEQEIRRLDHADYVIAHNAKMRQWLQDHGLKARLDVLEIFDYVSTSAERVVGEAETAEPPYTVVYAGALTQRKNAFLYEWGSHINSYRVCLYGSNFDVEKVSGREKFTYKGFVKSDTLIDTVEGHFGLVWDGPSTKECTGNFGEYLRLNNPHKTSLYIRCCLPVIIWSQAALAHFVREHRLGLCVDSLEDLDGVLARLSPGDYMEMRRNAARESHRLQTGVYVVSAVKRALQHLGL